MVMGHSCAPITKFIYLFHMALFFMISGYFFKEKCYSNTENLKEFIKRKVKSLYLPLVLFSTFIVLSHNFFLDINILSNNPLIEKMHLGKTFEYYSHFDVIRKLFYVYILAWPEHATWFLKALFMISVSFGVGCCIVSKICLKKTFFETIRAFICINCLGLGFLCHCLHFNFYQIGTMLTCSFLFYLGIIYKKNEHQIHSNLWILILSFLFLLYCTFNLPNQFELVQNRYDNPVILIMASITGFLFILEVSKILSKFIYLKQTLSYIGKNTMVILCFHFLFLKLVTYIQIIIYHRPSYMLASFPVLISSDGWWILYTITGIAGPLILSCLYKKCKLYFKKIFADSQCL